jgi:hypothetical protein
MHHVVEILLPTASNDGEPFGRERLDCVRDELVQLFGGVTLFSRSPAEGLWADGGSEEVLRDRVITVEVMTDQLDVDWWATYRTTLQERIAQEEILVRRYHVRKL